MPAIEEEEVAMPRTLLPFLLLFAASAVAQVQTTTLVTTPHPGYQGRLAYDAARQRIVLSNPGQPTWEHDGAIWAQGQVALPAGVMLYDPSSERVLVVGASGVVAYDGSSTTVIGPSLAALEVVADTARGRLVAVTTAAGGGQAGIQLWEFASSTWSPVAQIMGNLGPMGAAFDPVRGTTVITVARYSPPQRELWEWNGTTLLGPLQLGLAASALAFDPASQQVLVAGSSGASLWDGTVLTPVSTNWDDQYGLVCVDVPHGRVLRSWANSMWSWTGSSWQDLMLTPMPAVSEARFTYDAIRARAVLLGSSAVSSGEPLHAEWDGAAWRVIPIGPNGPATLYLHSQAFDAARGETVVFGGSLGVGGLGAVVGTTHAWNGSNWRLAASTGPAPRRGAAMTYDSLLQRVVMIGGRNPVTHTSLFDHWEWDGVSWTQVAAFTPFSGWAVVLGFDPVRGRLVAHDLQQRTFEYDGVGWTPAATAGPILAYASYSGDFYNEVALPSFTWDAANQMLVANCLAGNSIVPFGWNGVSWTQLARPSGAHATVPATGALLAWNGDGLLLVSDQPARTESYGAGCGGTITATSLRGFGRPALGNADFQFDLRADARLMPAAFGFGDSVVGVPLGNGCSLLVGGLFAVQAGATDGFGFARLSLPIPSSAVLRGMQLQAQALVFDPASAGGLAFTQGLTLTLGD